MAEVFGVVVSAAQLLEYSLKLACTLTEAFEIIKNAPQALKSQSNQLSRLVDVAREIKQNDKLHTETIHAQVNATLVEAQSLQFVLQSVTHYYTKGAVYVRYWRAIRKKGQKTLLDGFERLEREKLALILSISIASANNMANMDRNLGKAVGNYPTGYGVPVKVEMERDEAMELNEEMGLGEPMDLDDEFTQDHKDIQSDSKSFWRRTNRQSQGQPSESYSHRPNGFNPTVNIRDTVNDTQAFMRNGASNSEGGDIFIKNSQTYNYSLTHNGHGENVAVLGRHMIQGVTAKNNCYVFNGNSQNIARDMKIATDAMNLMPKMPKGNIRKRTKPGTK